jgi:hypothetical protein
MVSPPERAQASEVQISTITMTERVRPAEPTVRITATKPPTPNIMAATSTPTIALQIFYYSYYYPDLLAPSDIVNGVCANQENGVCHTVNCWDYDVMEGKCKSKMASGLDWHAYVSKAVAYGFEYPLGTVFRVRKPAKIAGDYPCLDRCPACTNKRQLNFLNVIQQLPWNLQLVVIVII